MRNGTGMDAAIKFVCNARTKMNNPYPGLQPNGQGLSVKTEF
jgi:hypothetical protein